MKLFFCVISFFFIFFIPSATSQITGRLVDTSTQEPLEYATAALFSTNDNKLISGTITNENGFFEFSGVAKGSYYIEASFMGYKSKKIENVTVSSKKANLNLGTVSIDPSQLFLEEVTISGEKATLLNKIDKQIYEADRFKNSQGGNATDVLKNLPSITTNGVGEILVRGNSGFTVLLNGKPLLTDPASILNQLPANAVEKVEVITAPSAKYDPDGKVGILNIITKKGAADGAFAQINVKGGLPSIESYDNAKATQRYGIDVTYNLRNDKWNLSLGGSYDRSDVSGRREGNVFTIIDDTKTIFPSDGERSFDATTYSGRFNLSYIPDTLNTYSLGFYAGKRQKNRLADIVYFDNHAVRPADSENRLYTLQYFNHNLRIRTGDFVLGSFDYSHTFGNASKLSMGLLYEYTLLGGPTTNQNLGFPDTSFVFQDEYNTNENPLNGTRLQLDYQFRPLDIGNLEIGYSFSNLDHKGDFVYERRNNATGAFELVPEFSSQVDLTRKIHATYAQLSKKKDKLEYIIGARTEFMDRDFVLRDRSNTVDTTYTYDFVKVYPSASLQYQLKEKVKLKAAYSKRVQRTTTFKMNPFPEREHSETLEQGDPTLLPEFVDLVEVGIVKNGSAGNSLFATAYFSNVKNLVNLVNTVYNDTILNRIYSNVGMGKSIGLEVGSQIKPTDAWSNFIGLNVYNYDINGSFDNKKVDAQSWVFSLNTNSTYAFNPTTSLQFTFNYLSKRVTAQGEDSEFYSPNLSFQKSFLNNRLTATLQWQNIDMGLLKTNEQRITTSRPNDFFTTTNYVYEVDVVLLNLSYNFSKAKNQSKFIKSEFGEREF